MLRELYLILRHLQHTENVRILNPCNYLFIDIKQTELTNKQSVIYKVKRFPEIYKYRVNTGAIIECTTNFMN